MELSSGIAIALALTALLLYLLSSAFLLINFLGKDITQVVLDIISYGEKKLAVLKGTANESTTNILEEKIKDELVGVKGKFMRILSNLTNRLAIEIKKLGLNVSTEYMNLSTTNYVPNSSG